MPGSGGDQTWPLTAAEKTDVRRFVGFGVTGAHDYLEPETQTTSTALDTVLNTLSGDQSAVVRTRYLARLVVLEDDLFDAREDLDTNKAAVWERNTSELLEKEQLFTQMRYRLAQFVGILPGPGIGQLITAPASCCPKTTGTGSGTVLPPGAGGSSVFVPAVFVV
jgi:hypothetical protein